MVIDLNIKPTRHHGARHPSRNFGSTEMLFPAIYESAASPKLNEAGHADRSR
jgi:hypothetical protein